MKKAIFFLAFFGALCMLGSFSTASAQTYRGVNLAGAAFSPNILPGVYGQNYVYPNAQEIAYFAGKGMNTFRVSILWERLQPSLNGHLDGAELARLTDIIAAADAHGAYTIIDIHNYGRYRGVAIGQTPVTPAAFVDLWTKLSKRFGSDNHVLFGLMNEPQLAQPSIWQAAVQQAIDGIRSTGAQNPILVSGTQWDSAQGFASVSAGLSQLHDPSHKLIFEVHEYFDTDTSGTSDRCVPAEQAVSRLTSFTEWLRTNGQHGFLGEFGVSERPECLSALDQALSYLHANSDVWSGWTYWSAGPLWGNYMYTIEPSNGQDRPQMQILQKYLGPVTN